MYYIYRNNQQFGPYPLQGLVKYVEDGKILLRDEASEGNHAARHTVSYFLKKNKVRPSIKNEGSIIHQISKIGKQLIYPSLSYLKKDFANDKRLIYLSIIGLAPAVLIRFTFSNYFTFYAIALYFSFIWAVFFYYLFRTSQVEVKKAVGIFFLTQVTALVLVNLQVYPPLSYLYALIDSPNFFNRIIGFVFGVGITEETIKALPIFFILMRSKKPLFPQTMVYYGLLSGIGFGILEAIDYQTKVNIKLDYSNAFFMNIARLTSLPFLHAVWCGIASYFLSFSFLYPKYRKSMLVLAISIPALLHGLYDVFGWSYLGLGICVFSVVALMFYLKKSADYQNKLVNL
jgi:RsiW-degrading membrane proteinase PrsW (M82 family)